MRTIELSLADGDRDEKWWLEHMEMGEYLIWPPANGNVTILETKEEAALEILKNSNEFSLYIMAKQGEGKHERDGYSWKWIGGLPD